MKYSEKHEFDIHMQLCGTHFFAGKHLAMGTVPHRSIILYILSYLLWHLFFQGNQEEWEPCHSVKVVPYRLPCFLLHFMALNANSCVIDFTVLFISLLFSILSLCYSTKNYPYY